MSEPLTKDWLINNYLFGIDLTDDYGNPYPDEQFDFAIQKAIEELNGFLDYKIGKKVRNATIDLTGGFNMRRWFYFNFPYKPIWSVNSVQFKFGNQKIFNVPTDWVVTDEPEYDGAPIINGRMNLVPRLGSQQGKEYYIIVTTLWSQMGRSAGPYLPRFLKVKALCGADNNEVPADILNFIGMRASLLALNIAGDLLVGAGIASKSVSLDGANQNINTTSSATNAGYGARILQYWKDWRQVMVALQRKYNGIRVRGM